MLLTKTCVERSGRFRICNFCAVFSWGNSAAENCEKPKLVNSSDAKLATFQTDLSTLFVCFFCLVRCIFRAYGLAMSLSHSLARMREFAFSHGNSRKKQICRKHNINANINVLNSNRPPPYIRRNRKNDKYCTYLGSKCSLQKYENAHNVFIIIYSAVIVISLPLKGSFRSLFPSFISFIFVCSSSHAQQHFCSF